MGNLFKKSKPTEDTKGNNNNSNTTTTTTNNKSQAKKQELNDTDKAQLELKRARDRLRRQQEAAERCIQQEKSLAKELVQKGQKDKAILVLKRKAMKEKMLERARNQMLNVETMIGNIEEADNNLKVFEKLRLGNETLKNLQDQMSIDDINNILDDTAESIRVQEEISAALGQNLNTAEQAEIDEEIQKMFALMDQGVDPFAVDNDVQESKPTKQTTTTTTAEPEYGDLLPDAPTHGKTKQTTQDEEQVEEQEAVLA